MSEFSSFAVVILFTGLFLMSFALPRSRKFQLDSSSSRLRLLLSNNSDSDIDIDDNKSDNYDDTLQFKSQLDAISKIIASQTQQLLENFNAGNLNLKKGEITETNSNISSAEADNDDDDKLKPLIIKKMVEPQFFTPNGTLLIRDYKKICGRKFLMMRGSNKTGRIIGGQNSSFAQHPWQISLMIWKKTKFYHACGAVLLNENWAVTAAHCTKHVRPTDLLLRFGQFDFSESESYFVERRVRIISRHPKFDPEAWNFKYDLALLKFTKPVDFSQNIIPICLPPNEDKLAGKEAIVTGWGRVDTERPNFDKNTKYVVSLPSKLQQVSVPIVTNKECNAMYVKAGFIDEKFPDLFICAGLESGGRDACDGDSGGPMTIKGAHNRWFLAGIVSFGIGCGEPNKPGLYTRISIFRHWIEKIIAY